jgi:hypothetical protein
MAHSSSIAPLLRKLFFAVATAVSLLAAGSSTAQAQPLTNHGGLTMQHARAHLIFWQPPGVVFDPAQMDGVGTYRTLPATFFSDLSGTSYLNIVTQYPGACGNNQCVLRNTAGAVSLVSTFVDAIPYPHAGTVSDPLQDGDIQNEIKRAISLNSWTAGEDAVFFVFTGAGIEECNPSSCTFKKSTGFCAYHGSFGNNGSQVIYGYLSDGSFNSLGLCNEGLASPVTGQLSTDREVVMMSHEFIEMITDPHPNNAWVDLTNNEIGDLCNQTAATVNLNGNTYAVQQQWSNFTGCASAFGPSIQLTIGTGADDLRGDSDVSGILRRGDTTVLEPIVVHSAGDASWGSHSSHIVVAPYVTDVADLGSLDLSLFSHHGDTWDIERLDARLYLANGFLLCDHDESGDPLAELTPMNPTATFLTPSCAIPPPPPATTFYDSINFEIRTGTDDLRSDSDAIATVNFMNAPPATFFLKAAAENITWDSNSHPSKTFGIVPPQKFTDITSVVIRLVTHNHDFETDDNWDVNSVHVNLLSGGNQGCFFDAAGNPFVRLTTMNPTVTLSPGSGC